MGVQLNVDIPGSISELHEAMKDFALRLKLYRIILRGKALEFEGYRTYEQDDDASLIDWKASTRANKLMVKQYHEEQDVKILFVVDVGEHMVSGSTAKLKCEYATEAAVSLAHLVLDSGDKIGLIAYNDKVKEVILPKRGLKHFQYFTDVLSDSSTYSGGSSIDSVLDFLTDYVDRSIKGVIIISDFINFPDSIADKLGLVGSKFETFAIMVKDPMDRSFPAVSGEVTIENPISGEQLLVNPRIAGAIYADYTAREQVRVEGIFKKANIDLLSLTTDLRFVPMLAEFLKARARQRKTL